MMCMLKASMLVDWRVAGGLVNATTSFNTFESILGNASTLSTGCVWIDDLYNGV